MAQFVRLGSTTAVAVATMAWITSAATVAAQNVCDITVALSATASSIDPHFHNLTPNSTIGEHIYNKLVLMDENLQVKPGLATSWEVSPEDPRVWTFHLREGVTWHDGTPFSAEDVVFSYDRIPNVPNSPSSYAVYTKHVEKIEIVDPLTVRFTTKAVFPLMPQYAAAAAIVSRSAVDGRGTEDFNSGVAAIGTGAYRFKEYVPGEKVILERNEAFWGDKPDAKTVEFRFISNDATRVAALRAGDVDLIDAVPTVDVEGLRAAEGIDIAAAAGVRNIYLFVDQGREETPFVTDKTGAAILNPLMDIKVRQALSLAINRNAIVKAIMSGQAAPSSQLLPKGMTGHVDELDPPGFDPEKAKALLAEAGYPDGFRVTVHGPNDRYVNDAEVVQAVAQMWARIGVEAEVDTMPASVYFTKASKLEYTTGLLGWGTGTGEPDSPMAALLATRDKDKGRGTANRSIYSNPEFDTLLDTALSEVDLEKRAAIYQDAIRVSMGDVAIIPLHHQFNIWAMRDGLSYIPRVDERTLAMGLTIGDEACD